MERQTDRQTDGQAGRQAGRKGGRQAGSQPASQPDSQKDTRIQREAAGGKEKLHVTEEERNEGGVETIKYFMASASFFCSSSYSLSACREGRGGCTNSNSGLAGLGLVAPDFINHFVD